MQDEFKSVFAHVINGVKWGMNLCLISVGAYVLAACSAPHAQCLISVFACQIPTTELRQNIQGPHSNMNQMDFKSEQEASDKASDP